MHADPCYPKTRHHTFMCYAFVSRITGIAMSPLVLVSLYNRGEKSQTNATNVITDNGYSNSIPCPGLSLHNNRHWQSGNSPTPELTAISWGKRQNKAMLSMFTIPVCAMIFCWYDIGYPEAGYADKSQPIYISTLFSRIRERKGERADSFPQDSPWFQLFQYMPALSCRRSRKLA